MIDTENITYPAPKEKYKVLVRCFTFNQSKYIEDTLNGFAMQQTDFPFVCLVMDDASTDGEQEVIKNWMDRECDMSRAETIYIPTSVIIIVPHKTNTTCTFAFYLLTKNLYRAKELKMSHVTPWRQECEYEAICEGDDYWIDHLKLQKQVNFLDSNSDYGMCYTRAMVIKENEETTIIGTPILNLNTFLRSNVIATLTVCLRSELMRRYCEEVSPEKHNWLMGDYPIWFWIYLNSKIHYIDEITSVYRVLKESASHSTQVERQISFIESAYDIRAYYIKWYLNNDKQLFDIVNVVRVWSIFRAIIVTGDERRAFEYINNHLTELPFKYQLCCMLMKYSKLIRRYMSLRFNKIA